MSATLEKHHSIRAGSRGGSIIVWPSGRRVFPLDLKVSDIELLDIAHSLSMICRYNGHVSEFYSVAQHCCWVHDLVVYGDDLDGDSTDVDEEEARWALLHDAAEYVMQDIMRPLKYTPDFGSTYRVYEAEAMGVICQRFELDPIEPDSVSEADLRLCATEQRDLRGLDKKRPKPYAWKVKGWSPEFARKQFMSRAKALGLK